jgi:signal peptidase I
MEDTLLLGDCLLIEKLSYGALLPFGLWHLPGLGRPTPGDIIVFRLPEEPDRVYVKRCLATAGQVVEVVDKVAYVDGVRLADPAFSKYIDARIFSAERSSRDNFGPVEVPAGSVFLLGDNRDNSRDSRHWGFVPVEALVGRSLGVYWSVEPRRGTGSWMEALKQLPQRIRWERLGQRLH